MAEALSKIKVEVLAMAIHSALRDKRGNNGGLVYTYNDFVDYPEGTIGIDGDVNLYEFAELILKHLPKVGL